MKDMKDKFNNIIGQKSAKKKLEFFIDGYDASGIIPHLMFVAPKGSGKTWTFPEIDRALMLNPVAAKKKLRVEQEPFIDRLLEKLPK